MRLFGPLLHRNSALFWASELITLVGQYVREVALYWLAQEEVTDFLQLFENRAE